MMYASMLSDVLCQLRKVRWDLLIRVLGNKCCCLSFYYCMYQLQCCQRFLISFELIFSILLNVQISKPSILGSNSFMVHVSDNTVPGLLLRPSLTMQLQASLKQRGRATCRHKWLK